MARKTDLHVLRQGSLTRVRYGDETLDVYVRCYAGAIGDNFILMDDKAPPHRARVVENYLQPETIESMDWSATCSDLNPIVIARTCCRQLFHVVITSQPVSKSWTTFYLEEWNALDQNRIKKLIRSMTRRDRAVNAASGSHTEY